MRVREGPNGIAIRHYLYPICIHNHRPKYTQSYQRINIVSRYLRTIVRASGIKLLNNEYVELQIISKDFRMPFKRQLNRT